jgi:hypothetical protein
MDVRRTSVIAFGVAVVLALAGCAPTPVDTSSVPSLSAAPSLWASAAPTAEAQERETGLTRPALVFDGQCDRLFTDAEIKAVMGSALPLVANHWDEFWSGNELFAQHGGFECTWSSNYARVIALVLPVGAVEYPRSDDACRETHDSPMSCPMESVTNGIRLSGLVALGVDPAAGSVARDALVTVFDEKAAKQTPVPVPLAAPGSWQLSFDCAAIASAADFSAVPGLGASTVDASGFSAGKDSSQAEKTLAPIFSSCGLQGESAGIAFIPVGGARWRQEQIAARADATPLNLKGVDAAYSVPFSDRFTLVYAFSGPNMLMFQVRYTKNAAGIATALFASLDSTAVS